MKSINRRQVNPNPNEALPLKEMFLMILRSFRMKKNKQKSVITTTMDVFDGVTQFSDLPSCLVIGVLLRLPIRTLVTCICVCRDWTRLFQDPDFIKLHLAASPVHFLKRRVRLEDGIFQFWQVMEEDLEVKTVNLPNKVNLPHSAADYGYECVNSCNGLLCLVRCDYYRKLLATSVCVCNPILGEWVSISTPVRNYATFGTETTLALVFSAKNNQYKLLHGFETEEKEHGFEIYTLDGTRQWRSIGETLGCRPWSEFFYCQDFNTFVHGSLHWNNRTQDFICCFDVDREKFRRLSLPIPLTRFSGNSSVRSGVINGRLCAVYFRDRTDVEIWALKEYGVENSWVNMVNFQVCIGGATIRFQIPFVLFSLNEEEILIYCYNQGLFSYNLKTNKARRRKEVSSVYGVAYNPSFISLQDVAKGEQVMYQEPCK